MVHSPCNSAALFDRMPREDGWVSAALDAAIRSLARTGAPFSADDLWSGRFGFGEAPDPELKHSDVKPQEVGAAFRRAATQGFIRLLDYKKSKRKGRRGGLIRVWIGTAKAHQ